MQPNWQNRAMWTGDNLVGSRGDQGGVGKEEACGM